MVDSKRVTSALTQWESAKTYQEALETIKRNGALSLNDQIALILSASGPFVGLMLSAAAYRDLKLGKDLMPDDPSFAAGAKKRAAVLNDPPAEQWEKTFQATLHTLVIVADDDDTTKRIDPLVTELKKELKAIGATVAEETGTAMRLDEKGQAKSTTPVREHFGFADGVSQPLFFARDIERAKTRRGGIDQYDPSAPLDQVLVKDPADGDNGYGSYFVYRKLQQDVQGFRDDELALATEIAKLAHPKTPAPTDDDIALAGAYMVGRFKDGTPVVDRDVPGLGSAPNNFSFDRDVDGVRCPFQAHIRKTNPRGDKQRQFGVPVTQERTQRIARRAISFGPVTLEPGEKDNPLLLVAGTADRIVPPSVVHENHRRHLHSEAVTEYREYPDRDHGTCFHEGWERVADESLSWAAQW
ncbi:hypothetical protein ACFW1M_23180 [Streptomyces inhibens]|uniref:hypothetical protein n=1 Tax=Streptomyces inhibens TaxID=2293571 RepID=UPI0036BAA2CA